MSDLRVNPGRLEALIAEILAKDGCPAEEARAVASHLVAASLAGHDSHGVIRAVRYHEWLAEGRIKAGQPLEILLDTGTALHLDGGDGMGQRLAREATAMGIARAREHGFALAALRRAGHIGRVGTYAEQACAEGIVSVLLVNFAGSRLVAPFGSARRCISTDPVAIGVPNGDGDHFVLDFATALVAEGKALVAAQGGKALPGDALIDGAGRETGDPRALYGATMEDAAPNPSAGPGALRTFGDHKGSGLALACELLAGALTGNGTNSPNSDGFGNGMLAIFVDAARFDDGGGFVGQVADYIDFVRNSTPARGVETVLVPGDKERATRAERLAAGLPMPAQVLDGILAVAAELSIGTVRERLLMSGRH